MNELEKLYSEPSDIIISESLKYGVSVDCVSAIDNYIRLGLHPGSYFMALIKACDYAHPLELPCIGQTTEYIRKRLYE